MLFSLITFFRSSVILVVLIPSGTPSIKTFKQSRTIPNVVNIIMILKIKVQTGSTTPHSGFTLIIIAAMITPILWSKSPNT